MRSDPRDFNRMRNKQSRIVQNSPHRVYDIIRSGIRTGMFASDSALVEDTLMRTLYASRNAVRQALQMLASEGIVLRRPSLGTTVAAALENVAVTELVQDLDPARVEVTEIEHRQVPATGYIRSRLGVEAEEELDVHESVIAIDHIPHSLRVSYVPRRYGPINRVMEPIPVPVAFERVFGRPLGRQESTIGGHAADVKTARLLGITEGAVVLVQETLAFDDRGTAREFSYVRHRGDRVSIAVQISDQRQPRSVA